MLGLLILALTYLDRLPAWAIAAAISVEAAGTERVFAPHLQARTTEPGQAVAAAKHGAGLLLAHRRQPQWTVLPLVQDAYSLRCAPQVAGAARDTVAHARNVANWELAEHHRQSRCHPRRGSVDQIVSFHGAPVADGRPQFAIVVADLASISERRTDRFLDAARSHGLNPFLADDPGVDSGHMIAQYTQAAYRSSAQSEWRRPRASSDILAMQEDDVSMGGQLALDQ